LLPVPVLLAVVALSAAGASPGASGIDPAPPLAFAPVRLAPVPARVVASCRSIQARARVPLLCPTLLPRATVDLPGLPPRALSIRPYYNSVGRPIAGVDIGYSSPWEGRGWRAHRWRNRPCCFLHFNVFRRAPGRRAIPKKAQRATLGGKHGLLVPGREGAYYGSELYSANHVRFLWRERGVDWVATLHTFGEAATERLLGRLIGSLRPVDLIRMPPQRGTLVGVTPNAIAAHSGSVWVASFGTLLGNVASPAYGTVYRVNPSTAEITARVNPAGGGGPHALALTRGAVWAATYLGIARIDPRSVKRVAFLNVGRCPKGIVAANGRLWVAGSGRPPRCDPFGNKEGSLISIDPATNRLVGRPIPLGRAPTALAAGNGALWVVDEVEGTLTRVDPTRRRIVARVKVGQMPTALAVRAGSGWVANTGDGTVSRIDPRTDRVADTFRVGVAPRALAVGAGAIWVVSTGTGLLSRIDPVTGKVAVVRRGLGDPIALAVQGRDAWITTNDGELLRLTVR